MSKKWEAVQIPAGILRFGRGWRYTRVASLGLMVMLWKRFSM